MTGLTAAGTSCRISGPSPLTRNSQRLAAINRLSVASHAGSIAAVVSRVNADASIPIGAPIDAAHGVDPLQPQTLLEVPDGAVLSALLDLWRSTKKASDVVLVFDKSGSMQGDPLTQDKARPKAVPAQPGPAAPGPRAPAPPQVECAAATQLGGGRRGVPPCVTAGIDIVTQPERSARVRRIIVRAWNYVQRAVGGSRPVT